MTDHKGLSVHVWRAAHGVDCTNGGISAKVASFTVIGTVRSTDQRKTRSFDPLPKGSQVFTPSETSPAAVLVIGAFPGCPPNLVPLETYLSGKWFMHGGNLADSSDGRWGDAVSSFFKDAGIGDGHKMMVSAVDIHDRVEDK